MNSSHFIPFGYRRYDFDILTLRLCKQLSWGLTYFDEFNMRSFRLITFNYVVLFLEFSQCSDSEKVQFLDRSEIHDLHLLLDG